VTVREQTVVLLGIEPVLTDPTSLSMDVLLRTVNLDLQNLVFVSPLDLVTLASWSITIPREARGRVLLPDPSLSSYLERMRLLECFRDAGWNVPETEAGPWEDLPERLLEVTSLAGPNDVEDLADRLPRLWQGRTGNPPRSRALHFAFGELSDNATTHSGESPIFVAAQRYTGLTSPHPARLELAVADGGIGVPAHLRSNPDYAEVEDDGQAILLALRPGVTGTRDQRGYGFHDVLREVGEVGTGELVVVAGKSMVVAPFGQPSKRKSARRLPNSVKGTLVQVRIYEDE
jgi:hypothetical protein